MVHNKKETLKCIICGKINLIQYIELVPDNLVFCTPECYNSHKDKK